MEENSSWNPLQGVFDLLGKKIDADANRSTWAGNDPRYGVDEYGRVYMRGAASTAVAPGSLTSSPLVMVGVAVLVVTLAVVALKH